MVGAFPLHFLRNCAKMVPSLRLKLHASLRCQFQRDLMSTSSYTTSDVVAACLKAALKVGLRKLPVVGVAADYILVVRAELEVSTGDSVSEDEIRDLIVDSNQQDWEQTVDRQSAKLDLPASDRFGLRRKIKSLPLELSPLATKAVLKVEMQKGDDRIRFLEVVRNHIRSYMDASDFQNAYYLLEDLLRSGWANDDDRRAYKTVRSFLLREHQLPSHRFVREASAFMRREDVVCAVLISPLIVSILLTVVFGGLWWLFSIPAFFLFVAFVEPICLHFDRDRDDDEFRKLRAEFLIENRYGR